MISEPPEAYYWLGKIHLERDELEQADEDLAAAVELMRDSSKISAHDKSVYIKDWADLGLLRARRANVPSSDPEDVVALLDEAELRAAKLSPYDRVDAQLNLAQTAELRKGLLKSAEQRRAIHKAILSRYVGMLQLRELTPHLRISVLGSCVSLLVLDADSPKTAAEFDAAVKFGDQAVQAAEQQTATTPDNASTEARIRTDNAWALFWSAKAKIEAAKFYESNRAPSGSHQTKVDRCRSDAIAQLVKAARLDPEHPKYWQFSVEQGELLYPRIKKARQRQQRVQLLEQAVKHFDTAVKRYPNDDPIKDGIGHSLKNLQRLLKQIRGY